MEKLSPFSSTLHMSNDLSYLDFILFFGILFIEDTVGFIAETDASEEVRRITAKF
jgi:hypothetical protein